jgi:hypothetical protein
MDKSHVRELVVKSREEAESVLEALRVLINRFGMASVSDLYDLVGLKTEFADTRLGWRNLEGATIGQVDNGYVLDLPSTVVYEVKRFMPNSKHEILAGDLTPGMVIPFGYPPLALYLSAVTLTGDRVVIVGSLNPDNFAELRFQITMSVHRDVNLTRYETIG